MSLGSSSSDPVVHVATELCATALLEHPDGNIPVQSVFDMLLKISGREDVVKAMMADYDALASGTSCSRGHEARFARGTGCALCDLEDAQVAESGAKKLVVQLEGHPYGRIRRSINIKAERTERRLRSALIALSKAAVPLEYILEAQPELSQDTRDVIMEALLSVQRELDRA